MWLANGIAAATAGTAINVGVSIVTPAPPHSVEPSPYGKPWAIALATLSK